MLATGSHRRFKIPVRNRITLTHLVEQSQTEAYRAYFEREIERIAREAENQGGEMPPRTRTTPHRLGQDGLPMDLPAPIYKASDVGYGNMESQKTILPVLVEVANEHQVNISYGNPHGSRVSYVGSTRGYLTVLFYSAPTYGTHKQYNRAFGFDLTLNMGAGLDYEQQEGALNPDVFEVLRDEEGIPVIITAPGFCYIAMDIPHAYEDTEQRLAATLTRKALDLYFESLKPEEVELRQQKKLTAAQERVPQVVTEIMFSQLESQRAGYQNAIREYQRSFEAYNNEMQSALRQIARQKVELEKLELQNKDREKEVARALKGLAKVKGVNMVTTRNGYLLIRTDPIYIKTKVACYKIGRFTIELGANGHLKFRNLDKRIDNTDHPHILDGNPCLGNMEDIYRSLELGEVTTAVIGCLQYLKAFNPESAYAQVDEWDKVDEKEIPAGQLEYKPPRED